MQIFQLQNQPSNFIVFIFRIVTPAQQERRRTTEQNLQIVAQVFGLPPQTIRPPSESKGKEDEEEEGYENMPPLQQIESEDEEEKKN